MQAAAGQLLPCADRWQVLHPAHMPMGQPGGVSTLLAPGGLQSDTGSAVRAGGLVPVTRRSSPATGGAAGGAEPLAALAASLFGLSPDN